MRATKPKTSFSKPQLSIDSTNLKPTTTMSGQTTYHQNHMSMGGINNNQASEGLSVMSNIDRSQNGLISSSQQFISTQ